MKRCRKCTAFLLALLIVMTAVVVGIVPGTVKTKAASWNGYNYGGGKLYGYQSFLEAFGIDYDVYMKWMDDHDADSPNPDYYLNTPYAHNDHRNPAGDCDGAYGDYDTPGVAAMNCTGFVWHVLYKAAYHSGASSEQISRLKTMWRVPVAWSDYGVYRLWFDSIEEAYDSGVLEKGDLMWIYGSSDNHNAIFYGDSPWDFIYWDSAGERNRYCEVHSIGDCRGLWVAKVSQPNRIELQIDTPSGGSGSKFGTKYCVFNSRSKAQAALDHPNSDWAWDTREGTIVLDSNGHGVFREHYAPPASDLWYGNSPRTNHPYFRSDAKRVDSSDTYYAVQWSHSPGISQDDYIQTFTYSGRHTAKGYKIYRFMAPIHVSTPTMTSIKSVSDGIRMSWRAVPGTYRYRIYYKNYQGSWRRMAETDSTSYLDREVQRNGTYTYTLRCIDRYGNFISDFNTAGWRMTYTYADTPQMTRIYETPQGLQLTWTPVKNPVAKNGLIYRVYRKNDQGQWTRIGQTTSNTYLDDLVGINRSYVYTIRCVDNSGDFISSFNNRGWGYLFTGLDTPQLTSIKSETDGVRLKWNAIPNATKYRIYYKNAQGTWTMLRDTTDTELFDTTISPGETRTYTLRCMNNRGCGVSGFNSKGWRCTYKGVETPAFTSVAGEPDGIRLKWNPVEGAYKYRIFYKNAQGYWTTITETTGTEYLDHNVTLNGSTLYTIRVVGASGRFTSDYNKNGWRCTYTGVPNPKFSKIVNEPEGLRLKWDAIDGVAKYRVYRKNASGGWQLLTETTGTEYYDCCTLNLNTKYTYTIRCVNNYHRFCSDFNRTGWTRTYTGVATPQITGLESTKDGVKVTWDAVKGTIGYRVFRRGPSGWILLGTLTETEFTDTQATQGATCVYTVRCVGSKNQYISDFDRDGKSIKYTVPEASLAQTSQQAEPVTQP